MYLYIHTVSVKVDVYFTGFIIPLPTVIIVIVKNDNDLRYESPFFPHILLCQPNSVNYWFYSTIVPIDILCAVGLVMLMMIVWCLRKVMAVLLFTLSDVITFAYLYFQHQKFLNDSLHGSNGSKAYLSTPEIKLLVVFFFYVVFAVSVLAYNMVVTDLYGTQLFNDIKKYFFCEVSGNGSDHCLNPNGSQDIEHFSFPYLLAILLALLGVVPLVNLVFAINWNHLKDKLKLCKENVKNHRYGTFRYSLPQKAVNYSAVSKT